MRKLSIVVVWMLCSSFVQAEGLCPGSSRVGQFFYHQGAYQNLKNVEVKAPFYKKKIDEALIYSQWWEIPRIARSAGQTKNVLSNVGSLQWFF